MRRAGLLLAAGLVIAAAPDAARKQRMDRAQDAIDALYEAIDGRDGAGVAAQARIITDAFAAEAQTWRDAAKPDRAAWATASAHRADAIVAAAAAQDWPRAKVALADLNPPCRACHDAELPHR